MNHLQISLLGSPEIRHGSERIAVKPKKALALLVYLAVERRASARDTLAALLWPESGQQAARAALRRRLSELAGAIGEGWLLSQDEQVELIPRRELSIDLVRYENELTACESHAHAANEVCPECATHLEAAVKIYHDDFLSGFFLSDCPEFDDWQFFRAESCRQQLATALQRLIQLYSEQNDPLAAIPHARRWAALDPLHEPAHRALMRLYQQAGQRTAALRQYELCTRALEMELDVSPEASTVQLYEEIRASTTASQTDMRIASVITSNIVNTGSRQTQVASQDEVRIVTALALEVDSADESAWDRRPDEVSADIAAFLQAASAKLQRYEAYVQHIHEHGFQAVFGLPALHEDDAERAVRVALDLAAEASRRRLAVAAGVNTGAVYVRRKPGLERAQVSGPTLHGAVHLMGQSLEDSVLVDPITYRQTEQAFRYANVDRQVRGFGARTIYKAVRPRIHSAKSRGFAKLHAPLIGRDEEIGRLRQALHRSLLGQGQIVTVIGEAGLGKSRLVSELKTYAMQGLADRTAESVMWLEGRCLEMNRSVAYWPFIDILLRHFGWTPETPDATRAEEVDALLGVLHSDGRLSRERVEVMAPVICRLLSIDAGVERDEMLRNARPEQIRHMTLQSLADLIVALTKQQRVVLVLEDLHWADPLSFDLIHRLMEQLSAAPLLLLCVYRPEAALKQDKVALLASRKCPNAYHEIRLRELTTQHSLELVRALLDVEGLSARSRERILDACQANPFFLEEVIHDLIEANLIFREGEVWRASKDIEATSVPTRVQSVILARVDRLDPAPKQILQYSAVVGRLFARQTLVSMLDGIVDIDSSLAALEERSLIYAEQVVPDVVYSFRHVLAQEAVYHTIPGSRRTSMHGEAGDVLERLHSTNLAEVVDQLAYHFDRSDRADKAVTYLLLAGDKAAQAYATVEAVTHFRRSLERLDEMERNADTDAQRFHALSQLGKSCMRASRYEEAETYLRQAIAWGLESGQPVKQVVRLHWWLGDLLMNYRPRYDECLQTGLAGFALLDPAKDAHSLEAAMMYGIICFGYEFLGDASGQQKAAEALSEFLADLSYAEELRVCFGAMMEYHIQRKEQVQWSRWLEIAELRARQNHNSWALGEHLLVRSYVHYMHGDKTAALEALQESMSLLDQVGDARRRNWCDVNFADIMNGYGEVAEAEIALRKALPSTYEHNREHAVAVLLLLASCCMAQRKWLEATEALDEALQDIVEQNDASGEALTLLGFVQMGQGNRRMAVDSFKQALTAMDDPDWQLHKRRKWCLDVNSFFANSLYGLECALDDADCFSAFCREFRESHPSAKDAVFRHWALQTVTPQSVAKRVEMFLDIERLAQGEWRWSDLGDGATYTAGDGLTISSPPARDLLYPFLNAPRLMHSVSGDFSLQATCQPASQDRPGVGGLFLWQDSSSYLRLCMGVRAQDEISFDGCWADMDAVIGRGRLPADSRTLRLERQGNCLRALCSPEGRQWFLVGETELPINDSVEIGLVAIGLVDRTIYQRPYSQGTSIRFTNLALWT